VYSHAQCSSIARYFRAKVLHWWPIHLSSYQVLHISRPLTCTWTGQSKSLLRASNVTAIHLEPP
jgi:hypothetical protein